MTENLKQEDIETPKTDNSQDDQAQEAADDGLVRRYKEQISGSKQEAERLRNMVIESEVRMASKDSNSLLELNEKDPKLANEVAKRFGYSDFEDAKNVIEGPNKTEELQENKKGLTEDELEKWYQKRKEKEDHEKALSKAETKLGKLDKSVQEKAILYFDKLSKGKTLDEETALEFVEMATLYVSKDKLKADKLNEGIAMLGSTGVSNSKKVSKNVSEQDYIVRDGKLILNPNKQQ